MQFYTFSMQVPGRYFYGGNGLGCCVGAGDWLACGSGLDASGGEEDCLARSQLGAGLPSTSGARKDRPFPTQIFDAENELRQAYLDDATFAKYVKGYLVAERRAVASVAQSAYRKAV